MDIVTYAILKKQIDNVTLAYSYKGSVADEESLPSGAETGDLYTIDGAQYVWDGTNWIEVTVFKTITDSEIEALF